MNASQEQLPPEMLLTQAPFNSIFPIQTPVLQRIVDRMKKIGFDPAHPILVWKRGSDAVVIDGHTRLQAALSLGIRDIPVIFREFDNPGDALDYAVSQQVERRNMTPADMLRYIEAADKLLERGRKKLAPNGANSENHPVQHGKSAAKLAEVLNVSLRKAERLRKVAREGSDETKKALCNGDISVNKAYNDTVIRSASRKNTVQEESAISPEEQLRLAMKFRMKNIPENIIAALKKEIKNEKEQYPDLHYSEKQIALMKDVILNSLDTILNQLA